MNTKKIRNWVTTLGLFAASGAAMLGCLSKANTLEKNSALPQQSLHTSFAAFKQPVVTSAKTVNLPYKKRQPSLNSPLLKNTFKYFDRDKFSMIVVNKNTHEIVYAYRENDQFHPASLSKMMIAFIVLREAAADRFDLDAPLKMDVMDTRPHLAKLCVDENNYLTGRDALKAIFTRSAADAADLLAKNIVRVTPEFAEKTDKPEIEQSVKELNEVAIELGMDDTFFTNPSGWPGDDKNQKKVQRTTAHDMAIMTWSLEELAKEHDKKENNNEYMSIIGTKEYFFRKQYVVDGKLITTDSLRIKNHALTAGAVMGKTGWADASGYSTFLSIPKDGNEYIVGVSGGKSPQLRDKLIPEILEKISRPDFQKAKNTNKTDSDLRYLAITKKLNINRLEIYTPKKPEQEIEWLSLPIDRPVYSFMPAQNIYSRRHTAD